MPAPTKLFDVANGNGAVIGGETVTRGTLIWYKDNAAKNKIEDQFAIAYYGYQATVPNPAFNPALPVDPATNPQTIANPQSKAGFFNKQLTAYIKDIVRSSQVQAAAATAAASASATCAAAIASSSTRSPRVSCPKTPRKNAWHRSRGATTARTEPRPRATVTQRSSRPGGPHRKRSSRSAVCPFKPLRNRLN